jgi:hypothetical protein
VKNKIIIYTTLFLITIFQINCKNCNDNEIEKKLDKYTTYLIIDALSHKEFPVDGIINKKEMVIFIENIDDCYYDNDYFKEFVVAYFLRQYYLENLSNWHFDIRSNNTHFETILSNEYINLTNTKNKDFITSKILVEKLKVKNKKFNNLVLNEFFKTLAEH